MILFDFSHADDGLDVVLRLCPSWCLRDLDRHHILLLCFCEDVSISAFTGIVLHVGRAALVRRNAGKECVPPLRSDRTMANLLSLGNSKRTFNLYFIYLNLYCTRAARPSCIQYLDRLEDIFSCMSKHERVPVHECFTQRSALMHSHYRYILICIW
jgi:hypothetical protein